MDTEQITMPLSAWVDVTYRLAKQDHLTVSDQIYRVIYQAKGYTKPLTLTFHPEEAALIRETAHDLGIALEGEDL